MVEDRIGYRGDMLAELSDDADGPQLIVYVPPIDWTVPAPDLFHPEWIAPWFAGGRLSHRRSKRPVPCSPIASGSRKVLCLSPAEQYSCISMVIRES